MHSLPFQPSTTLRKPYYQGNYKISQKKFNHFYYLLLQGTYYYNIFIILGVHARFFKMVDNFLTEVKNLNLH